MHSFLCELNKISYHVKKEIQESIAKILLLFFFLFFCLDKLYNKIIVTIEAMDMIWYRPENTNIVLGSASVNIGTLSRYHIMSNASIVNNCIVLDALQSYLSWALVLN